MSSDYNVVAERNYVVVLPKNALVQKIDDTVICIAPSLISVDSHILVKSKYKEHMYQSLAGNIYTFSPREKRLVRSRHDPTKRNMKYDIKAFCTCFTREGQSFETFFIDSTLDTRYYNPELTAQLPADSVPLNFAPSLTPTETNPVYKTRKEYEVCDLIVRIRYFQYLMEYISQNDLDNVYEKVIKLIKRFNKTYIYMKSCEEDYGAACKKLCKIIEGVLCSPHKIGN